MNAFALVPTKTVTRMAGLAASVALLGCMGARNGALPSAVATKALTLAAQAPLGAPLAAEETAHFTPSIAQDTRGNRIAVWEEFDGQRFNIWAKRSVAGQGWGAALRIDSLESITPSDAYAPRVALNTVGEAIAVWQQSDGRHTHVRTSRFIPGVGWGTATSIGSATTHASAPQIAFDARGIALAVWQQFDGQQTQVWASQQPEGGNWAHAGQLGVRAGAGDALNPTIAVDSLGKATALWQQVDGTYNAIWARTYSASVGWGRPAVLEPHFQGHDMDSAPLAQFTRGSAVSAWQSATAAAHP